MLTAYYDLWTSPPTYDIVAFLCAVERERIRRGEDGVSINIIPGHVGGFRRDKFWPFTIAERQAMLDKVAAPMARMLPSAKEVAIWTKRPQRKADWSIGWMLSLYGLRLQVECMREGIRPLCSVEPWTQDPSLVTITLREAAHWPERNSNVQAWVEAAKRIEYLGFNVVVVRDTLHCDADEFLPEVVQSFQASTVLECRARLYRSAACNLVVNNGPAWFAIALDAPVLMLKPTVEGVMRTCSAAYFQECGIPPGGQIPGAPDYQQIAWQDDTADNIVAAFQKFMETCRSHEKDGIRAA